MIIKFKNPRFRLAWLLFATFIISGIIIGCGDSRKDYVYTGSYSTPLEPGPSPVPTPPPTPGPSPVPAPPVAVDDNYRTTGNVALEVSPEDGVLANDTLNGSTITFYDTNTSAGGTVSLAVDGGFTYSPPTGQTGFIDSFTYTLKNSDGENTAEVAIELRNLGLFVDNTAAPGGTGSLSDPYDAIQDAIDAAQDGDSVIVFATNIPYIEDIVMKDGVSLIGEGAGPAIDLDILFSTITLPSGLFPVIEGSVTLANDSPLVGLRIEASPPFDTVVASNVTNPTIVGNELVGGDHQYCVFYQNTTGQHTLLDNTIFVGNSSPTIVVNNNNAVIDVEMVGNRFIHRENIFASIVFHFVGSHSVNGLIDSNTISGDPTGGCYSLLKVEAALAGATPAVLTVSNNEGRFEYSCLEVANYLGGELVLQGNTFTGETFLYIGYDSILNAPFSLLIGGENPEDGNIFQNDNSGAVWRVEANNTDTMIDIINNEFNSPSTSFLSVDTDNGSGEIQISGNTLTGTNIKTSNRGDIAYKVAVRSNELELPGKITLQNYTSNEMMAAITNNLADLIDLSNASSGAFSVESLADLSGLNRGSSISTSGTITSIPEESIHFTNDYNY